MGSSSPRVIRAVLCDIGGVLHVGSKPVPGVGEALKKLSEACERSRVAVRFITNTDTVSRRKLAERLRDEFGFGASAPAPEIIFTAPLAARSLLLKEGLRPLLLVHPDSLEDYDGISGSETKAEDEAIVYDSVVVADVGKHWSIDRLNKALRILLRNTTPKPKLIGMSRTRYYADDAGLVLDSGSFVKMLEYASGTEATIVGKPSQSFFMSVLESAQCTPQEAIMIGDDIETDVGAAQSIGIQGLLVRTGKWRSIDEERPDIRPDRVFDNFPAAVDWICTQLSEARQLPPTEPELK